MTEILFPLSDAEEYLSSRHPNLQRAGNEFRWEGMGGVVTLKVTPSGKGTFDGLVVSEVVTLEYNSSLIANVPTNFISHANKWATVSAFVRGTTGQTSLVSKVGVFSGDRRAAEAIYAPLICMQASAIDWHVAKMMTGETEGDPEKSPFLPTNELPPYDLAEFESVATTCNQHHLYATLRRNHLTVEFPWQIGAVSRSFANPEIRKRLVETGKHSEAELEDMSGATSLLQIIQMQHPLYGHGIQSRLQIPTSSHQRSLSDIVNELNLWELSGYDLPPLFGAWCDGDGILSFVSFIPTQLCVPNLLAHLFHWSRLRSMRVRQWLEVSNVRN